MFLTNTGFELVDAHMYIYLSPDLLPLFLTVPCHNTLEKKSRIRMCEFNTFVSFQGCPFPLVLA